MAKIFDVDPVTGKKKPNQKGIGILIDQLVALSEFEFIPSYVASGLRMAIIALETWVCNIER